jgi:hypothetical protein
MFADSYIIHKWSFKKYPDLLSFLRKKAASNAKWKTLINMIKKGSYTDLMPQNKLLWACDQDKPGPPDSKASCLPLSPSIYSSGAPTDAVQQATAGSDQLDGLPVPLTLNMTSQQQSSPIQQTSLVTANDDTYL